MNLRVDLILESEQRSGSLLNKKFLLRAVAIVVPLAVLLLIFKEAGRALRLNGELTALTQQWKVIEPKQQQALRFMETYRWNLEIQKELEGWRKSRLDWHTQLVGLMRETPRNIQLQSLRVDQALQMVDNKTPARKFTLALKGKAVGVDAETAVKLLERRLREAPPFAGITTNVQVTQFGADPSKDAKKEDRIFEISCAYRDLKFE